MPPPAPRPLRVLHVISKLDRVRGSTSWLLNVLSATPPGKVHHVLVQNSGEHGDREGAFRAAGITLEHVRCSYYNPLPWFVRLRRLCRRHRIQVVHSHMSMLGGFDVLGAWLAGVPVRIVYLHSGGWLHRGSCVHRLLDGIPALLTRLFATAVWGPSEGVLRQWYPRRALSPRLRAVIGGVPLVAVDRVHREQVRRELGLTPQQYVVGHAGRFTAQKNHAGIVATFALLVQQMPHARLLLAGDGPLLEATRALVAHLGITDAVIVTGLRSDMPRLYAAMDVFFFPSNFEPLGLAVLEAQNAGLPVVASTVDGLREALAPCWHPCCAPPDDHAALCRSLVTLGTMPVRHRPDEFLAYFSCQAAGKRLLEAYREAAGWVPRDLAS